jgi:hypothetical protein
MRLISILQTLALLASALIMWGWLRALARFEFRGTWTKRFTFLVAVASLFLFGMLFARALELFR